MSTQFRWLENLITEEVLPESFYQLAVEYYIPLAKQINTWLKESSNTPLVIGVNGAQGTGKSTLSLVLKQALEHEFQVSSCILSIDDIYLTRDERLQLSEKVHPLLQTRGVPGTHDVQLGEMIIQNLEQKIPTRLPIFKKAIDDRAPEEKWISCSGTEKVLFFEGWCVGALPQEDDALLSPCNILEENEDTDSKWRKYVNEQLKHAYPRLFHKMDKLVMLKAPDFECVYEWRKTQEEKLRARTVESEAHSIMNDAQIQRFIMHYERLTRWMFQEMPARADCLLELDHEHHIVCSTYK